MESLTAEDPSSIGGYELRARLGEGGFGRVYLGLSPGGRAVAVKVLLGEYARDHEFLRRFQLEVDAARRVNGVYTAPVVAAGLDDRPPWLATAFVPGPPLQSAVAANGPLAEPALWRLLAGLVEALQVIHACGLIHRDLKPANVMLAADGPRVIDFGISKALDGTAMTSTGSVFGTPAFMAPEQAAGLEVSAATDVFALGGVLAFAATGAAPFGWGNGHAVLYRVVHAPPDLGSTPPRLRPVLDRCLLKDPNLRPSLAELASIGRDGPGGALGGQSPASFWPPEVGKLIRDYQDHLEGPGPPRPAGTGRHSTGQHSAGPGTMAGSGRYAAAPVMPQATPGQAQPAAPGARQGWNGYGNAPTGSLRQDPGYAGAPPMARPLQAAPAGYPQAVPQYQAPQAPQYQGPPQRPPGYGAGQRAQGTAPIATAVLLFGAGLSALGALAFASGLPLARETGIGALTEWRIPTFSSFSSITLPGVLFYLLQCGLWLVIARAAQAGQPWGKAAGTACLGILTLLIVLYHVDPGLLLQMAKDFMFTGGWDAAYQVERTIGSLLSILIAITGLAAVLSLWLASPKR